MMAAAQLSPGLMERLPTVRGRYTAHAPLAPMTRFRVGGPADVVFRPADLDDLTAFLRGKPEDVPALVIGLGSNLLVRDGGIEGVVIRLGKAFAEIEIENEQVRAGAAALDLNVARACQDAGVAGLEFLRGVPGTIGGALRMNAGAYGRELADVLVSARAVDPAGEAHDLAPAQLGLEYRRSAMPQDWTFVSAVLQGRSGEPAAIAERMVEIERSRGASQPLRARTGGSTFTNPPGARAWELIERAGCRGLRVGGAMVSEKHCNFLINTGDATARDIEELGEEVRRRVAAATGVTLEWEIRRIGREAVAAPGESGA